MATASRVLAPPVEVPPDKIILELSLKEAEVLCAITGSVTGSASVDSPRVSTDAIYGALRSAGVVYHLDLRPVSFISYSRGRS